MSNMDWTASPQDEKLETLASLDRLSVARGYDFQVAYGSMVGNYRDLRRWEADLGTLRELAELAGSSKGISNAL